MSVAGSFLASVIALALLYYIFSRESENKQEKEGRKEEQRQQEGQQQEKQRREEQQDEEPERPTISRHNADLEVPGTSSRPRRSSRTNPEKKTTSPARPPATPPQVRRRVRKSELQSLGPIIVSPADSDASPTPVDGDDYTFDSFLHEEVTPLTPPTSDQPTKRSDATYNEPPIRKFDIARESHVDTSLIDDEVNEKNDQPKHSQRTLNTLLTRNGKAYNRDNRGSSVGRKTKASAAVTTSADAHQESVANDRAAHETIGKPLELDLIIPFKLHERYQDDPTLCLASTKRRPGERCRQCRIPKTEVVRGAFESLSKLHIYYQEGKYRELQGLIKKIVRTTFCSSHRKLGKEEHRLRILNRVIDSLTSSENQQSQSLSSATQCFEIWLLALSMPSIVPREDYAISSSSPVFPPPSRNDSYSIEDIGAYTPARFRKKTIAHAICLTLWPPFEENARAAQSGWVYVLGHHSRASHRKIGFTKEKPTKRVREWNNACERTHELLYAFGPMPHAYLVEQLIHAELKDVRRLVQCERCPLKIKKKDEDKLKKHREWFNVSKGYSDEYLKGVAEKWEKWIKRKPYALRFDTLWSLRNECIHELDKYLVPGPLEEENEERSDRTSVITVAATASRSGAID